MLWFISRCPCKIMHSYVGLWGSDWILGHDTNQWIRSLLSWCGLEETDCWECDLGRVCFFLFSLDPSLCFLSATPLCFVPCFRTSQLWTETSINYKPKWTYSPLNCGYQELSPSKEKLKHLEIQMSSKTFRSEYCGDILEWNHVTFSVVLGN